jgi:ankyrin repeat protein
MAANKPFKHHALNLDRTQIRLFRLLPADRSGNLAGTIAIYDFEHCPEYRAVSYTWGLPYPTREISLEGQSFTVRENLWQFLDAARDYAKDWLWVDQVCIDQSTVDERNHQVSLMAKIYAKAFEVLIWLGTEAHGSGKAMEAINSGVDSIHQYESQVRSLFRRPYWDRLWILQEVLMGQNVLVLCGNQSFTWKGLEALFVPQGIEDGLWTYPVHIYNVALSLIKEKASFKGANRRLSYMLESFAGLQCEDTRDKVYGLLSLVRSSGAIPVDYSKTSADVFFNAIQRIVRDESFMEINSHFNVAQHLRDRMKLVNINDTEIFDFINKELSENMDQTALRLAATNGHEGKAKLLLDQDADEAANDSDNEYEETPLHQASANGHVNIVKLLLDQSADVNAADEYGKTALHQASANGHVNVVKLLLDQSVDINAADEYGRTPLYQASNNGHLDIIRLLLDRGADIETADSNRWKLLHRAFNNGHVDIVKLLLEKGADVAVASQEGWTPLYHASAKGYIDIVKLLLEKGADMAVASHGWTPLDSASDYGHVEIVKLLLEKGADMAVASQEGWTPLHSASNNGHIEIVKLLLEKDADMTVASHEGWTPLHLASHNRHVEVVKLLLATEKVDADSKNKWGRTPLSYAAENGCEGVVRLLLATEKVDFDTKDISSRTPLSYAAESGHEGVVQLLLATGQVDVDSKATGGYNAGWTPLSYAAAHEHEAVVKLLIEKGAEFNIWAREVQSMLQAAASKGSHSLLQLLLRKAKNVDIQGNIFEDA